MYISIYRYSFKSSKMHFPKSFSKLYVLDINWLLPKGNVKNYQLLNWKKNKPKWVIEQGNCVHDARVVSLFPRFSNLWMVVNQFCKGKAKIGLYKCLPRMCFLSKANNVNLKYIYNNSLESTESNFKISSWHIYHLWYFLDLIIR